MKKIPILLLIILLSGSSLLLAQQYPFRSYSIEEGLSEAVVHAIEQDNDGYLWLATGYGLNRFDGIRFENFFEEHGLNNNKVQSLFKDNAGRIWIGSDSGVNYIEGDSITTRPVFDALRGSSVIGIYQDRLGEMWFGTDGDGVWHLTDNGEALVQYSTSNGLVNNRVRAIVEDRDNGIWFATRGGITVLKNGNFRSYTEENGLPANRIRDIAVSESGTIWIGSRNGLVRMDEDSLRIYNTEDGLVNNLIQTLTPEPGTGAVWIGTEDGVSYFDGTAFTNYTSASGLTNNIIYSSAIDREQNVWFGTFGGGFNLFLGNYFANYTEENGLPADLATAITQDREGRIWIGTYGGGVTSLSNNTFDDLGINDRLFDDQVYDLYTDSKGDIWIGLREGVAIMREGRVSAIPDTEFPYRKVRDIMESSSGDYWISTYDDGIVRYNGSEYRLYDETDGLADNTVLGSVEGPDGSIWIATYGGVSRFKDGKFSNYTIQEGLPNNAVMYITKDDRGRIWASTFGGIAWFNGTDFNDITMEDGLPDRVCYFIHQSRDGTFWIGTTNGLVRFNDRKFFSALEEERDQAFQIITRDQGLVYDELNLGAVYEDREGHLWFGTVEGISHFYPDRYKGNPVPPEVHILGINASGREYEPEQNLVLSHDENFLEIRFSGINFTAPNQVIYEYKMSGIDPDWQQTRARNAKYPSLPPGDYTFRVHARNTNGTWSEELDTVSLTITAPFWMQWWFLLLNLIVVVGIIFLFYNYYRVRKMVDIERMRVRIASDLHDDVGASLTEIALQSDFLQAGEVESEFRQSLSQIGKQCRKIVSSLDDIVWSIDARNDTLGDLTDRMQDYILNTLESGDMQVQYDFEDLKMDNKLPVPVKENLYLIFKEAVNNISKYSNGDRVEISLNNNNGRFRLSIFDNGTAGRGKKKTGHGLRNMKMRAERIDADIDFETTNGFKIIVEGSINAN